MNSPAAPSTPLNALARIRPDVRAMHAYTVQAADGARRDRQTTLQALDSLLLPYADVAAQSLLLSRGTWVCSKVVEESPPGLVVPQPVTVARVLLAASWFSCDADSGATTLMVLDNGSGLDRRSSAMSLSVVAGS